jgi:hypothetical protein
LSLGAIRFGTIGEKLMGARASRQAIEKAADPCRDGDPRHGDHRVVMAAKLKRYSDQTQSGR